MDRIDSFQIGWDGPWSRVQLRDHDPRLTRIVGQLGLFGGARHWCLERRNLAFLPQAHLLRAVLIGVTGGCRRFGIENASELVCLTDERSYEEAMRIGGVTVRADTAEDVMRFYFHTRLFPKMHCHLVERAADVAWRGWTAPPEQWRSVDAQARPLAPMAGDGGFRFAATVKIGRDLLEAEISLAADGRVAIKPRETLVADLACVQGRWYDPARDSC